MLLLLAQWLAQDVRAFNVFGYITLRTVLAAMTALIISFVAGPRVIRWLAAKKIVYSTTLSDVAIANAKIERAFNPETVKKLVAESNKDFDISGPHLAAEAIKAGIVDEYHQILVPVIIGSGNYWLPKDVQVNLELVDVRKFENGFVHIKYKKV